MSIDKTVARSNGQVVVALKMQLDQVFTEYFSEFVEDVCYQHILKGLTENLEPEQIEKDTVEFLKEGVDVALKKAVREKFEAIVATGAEAIWNEMQERVGAND